MIITPDSYLYFGSDWLRSNSSYVLGVKLSWQVHGWHTREWRCLEKYFKSWFINPNLQDNQNTEEDTRAKMKNSISSILLPSSQLFFSINIIIRMGPVGDLPELQLDCALGDPPFDWECLSRLEIPYLRLRDPSLTKAKRSLTHNRSVVHDW